jgi:four helix bundle protein
MSTSRVLDAARWVVDEVSVLVDEYPCMRHRDQVLRSSGSIAANIREGNGRRPGAERNAFFRHARASAEETDEHLHANFRQGRIPANRFWRIHNRIAAIVKMLNRMMG